MPRVNTVKSARKAQGTCGGCGARVQAGHPYKWIKFRYGGRRVRCDKCTFRPSDLTQSKMSQVYAAQEALQDFLDDWDGLDHNDLQSAVDTAVSEIRAVAEEYQEACDNQREHFSESATADENEERANELESWADDIENNDIEAFDPEEEMSREEWQDHLIEQVRSAIESCPL